MRRVPAWLLYIVGPIPAVVYFYWGVTNQLGADPLRALEHQLGEWALQLLIATLLISPLRELIGLNLIKFRRAIGLLAFMYVTFHLLTYLVLDQQFDWWEIWRDLIKRPYIYIGMTGFAVMVPLAVTSNNLSIRKIGAGAWKRLHRLAYVAAAAGALHYLLLVKSWPPEPIIYCAIVAGLLGFRMIPRARRRLAA